MMKRARPTVNLPFEPPSPRLNSRRPLDASRRHGDDGSVGESGRALRGVGCLGGCALLLLAGCVSVSPPTDTGGGLTLSSPEGEPIQLTYEKDLQPVFASDCVRCHSGASPAAGYSMSDYASVVQRATPGDAHSPLVVATQPIGHMYGYFSGDRAAKSSLVYVWVVQYDAQESEMDR